MGDLLTNFAESTLASGISSSATTLTVAPGHGSRFPAATTGASQFRAVIVGATGSPVEFLIVTNRSGDVFTVTRQAEDATRYPAVSHLAGVRIVHVVTAGALSHVIRAAGVNPRDYGATGTGDDTAAMHKARDAAGVGGLVRVPAGFTLLTLGGVVNNVADQTWLLEPGATIKLMDGSPVNSVTVQLSGVRSSLIGPGTVDANKAGQTGNSHGVQIAADDVTVERVRVLAPFQFGICVFAAGAPNRAHIIRNYIKDSTSAGIYIGAAASETTGHLVLGNIVDRLGVAAGSIVESGIKVYNGQATKVRRVRVEGNHVFTPTSTTATTIGIELFDHCDNSVVTGNICVGGTMGVSLDTSDWCTVAGNTVNDFSATGIELAGSQWCAVTGNGVRGNGATDTKGILCDGVSRLSDGSVISGNTVTNCGQPIYLSGSGVGSAISGNSVQMTNASGSVGVYLNAVHSVTVVGNTLTGQTGQTLGLGLRIQNSTKVLVLGNAIRNVNADVEFVATNTMIDNVVMLGNLWKNPALLTRLNSISGSGSLGTAIFIGYGADTLSTPFDADNTALAAAARMKGYLGADLLNRADATGLGTATTGQTWTARSGTMQVIDGNASGTSTANNRSTLPSGTANHEVSAKVAALPSSSMAVMGRWTDTATFVRALVQSNGTLALQKVVNNTVTGYGSSSGTGYIAVGDLVTIVCKANVYSVYKNGVLFTTETDAGVEWNGVIGTAPPSGAADIGLQNADSTGRWDYMYWRAAP